MTDIITTMATLPTDLLILKNEGNTFCQNGEFLAAIERSTYPDNASFDMADKPH